MLYEMIGDIEIRVWAHEKSCSIDYAVMAFKNEQLLERVEGRIDKSASYNGEVLVVIDRLKRKYCYQ
jgi:hypothetical protein